LGRRVGCPRARVCGVFRHLGALTEIYGTCSKEQRPQEDQISHCFPVTSQNEAACRLAGCRLQRNGVVGRDDSVKIEFKTDAIYI
jgi:hypothetical protein